MRRFFYTKLAFGNLKKNKQLYLPYIFSFIGLVIMLYNICYLSMAKEIGALSGSQVLVSMMFLGMAIISFFSMIFLFYTNSFIVKRRKKEFGVFNILGMEKKHIGKTMLIETLIITGICIGVGILLGILLSKLMLLLLFEIISFDVVFGFEVPPRAIIITLLLFSMISLINLIYNLAQVHLSKPVELLSGGNVGEKEPKTKWLMAIIGIICLGIAYFMVNVTLDPSMTIVVFFPAVMLVIVGTFMVFTAGSIAILKLLRKNKNYYYKANHFTAVSGMIYRMKQNAAGLASICVLSTTVIFLLCTTISMFVGMEDIMITRYPSEIMVNVSIEGEGNQREKAEEIIRGELLANNTTNQNNGNYEYNAFNLLSKEEGKYYSFLSGTENLQNDETFENATIMLLDDYNRIYNENKTLKDDEMLLYNFRGEVSKDTLDFNGFTLKVKERLNNLIVDGVTAASTTESFYGVVKDINVLNALKGHLITGDDASTHNYYYPIDTSVEPSAQVAIAEGISTKLAALEIENYMEVRENSRTNFTSLYGGLMFIGLYLGLLFIMATVLIIYYKQIAEGFEDKKRFLIMQKVGMSKSEVKKSIKTQVLMVFFLPIAVAVVHIAAIFKYMTQLLSFLNLSNANLFDMCAIIIILVFIGFYVAVYALTAKAYYGIVNGKN